MIPTPLPLCFQVTKNHYLKPFSSLRSVSTAISVSEGILNGTEGHIQRSVQRNACKWCSNLRTLCPRLCKKEKPGSLGAGIAVSCRNEGVPCCVLILAFVTIMSSSAVIDAAM